MFRYYCKRIIKSPVFWGCVLLMTVLMLVGAYEDLGAAADNEMSIFYCFWVTTTIGISHVLVAAIVVIPFLFFHVDELEKGAVYYPLIRSGKTDFYLGQIAAALVSSVLVSLLSIVLFSICCSLCGAGWMAMDTTTNMFQGTYYEEIVQTQVWRVYLMYVIHFLLYSMPWVLVGMVLSLFTKHRYLILIGPFVIYLAVNYITQLAGSRWLIPVMTLIIQDIAMLPGGGIYYVLAYHLTLVVVLSAVYLFVSRRRYHHEGL